MKKSYVNERDLNLQAISDRHALREIEGFTSWRHFVVHEDRAWLLNAIEKIQAQAAKLREADASTSGEYAIQSEVQALLALLNEDALNELGSKET